MTRSIYRPPWRIDVEVRQTVKPPVSVAALVRAIASALDEVRAPAPAAIGLILSGDEELAALNEAHLGTTGATDVLSFPLLPPAAFSPSAGSPDAPRPPGSRLHLGDIVISVERAIEQAAEGRGGQTADVRWSAAEEMCLLVTHGVLHICGRDHAEPDEEAAMRMLERRLLSTAAPARTARSQGGSRPTRR